MTTLEIFRLSNIFREYRKRPVTRKGYISRRIFRQLITTKDFALQSVIGAKLELKFVLSFTAQTYMHLYLNTYSFSSSVLCTGLLTCCDTETKTMFTILVGQNVKLYWI